MARGEESKACKFGVCRFADWESGYAEDGVNFYATLAKAESMAIAEGGVYGLRMVVFHCEPVSRTTLEPEIRKWDGGTE